MGFNGVLIGFHHLEMLVLLDLSINNGESKRSIWESKMALGNPLFQ